MRETAIESLLVALCRAGRELCYKFVSPGRAGVPDRLRLRPVPPEHRALVAQYVEFIELKATGETPESWQLREHARLRALGYAVFVLDSKDAVTAHIAGRNHE